MIPARRPRSSESSRPGPGLTGMQISIRGFWTGCPPLTLCAMIRDQLRRQG